MECFVRLDAFNFSISYATELYILELGANLALQLANTLHIQDSAVLSDTFTSIQPRGQFHSGVLSYSEQVCSLARLAAQSSLYVNKRNSGILPGPVTDMQHWHW